MIQQQQQGQFVARLGERKHVIKLGVAVYTGFKRHPLMISAFGQLVQRASLDLHHLDICDVSQLGELGNGTTLAHARRNQQAAQIAASRSQCFANRIPSVQQLMGWCTLWPLVPPPLRPLPQGCSWRSALRRGRRTLWPTIIFVFHTGVQRERPKIKGPPI